MAAEGWNVFRMFDGLFVIASPQLFKLKSQKHDLSLIYLEYIKLETKNPSVCLYVEIVV